MPEKPVVDPQKGVILEAEFGTQRDNPTLSGGGLVMPSWADCGPEMCAGIIAQDIPGACENDQVMALLTDMEPSFDPHGWGASMLPEFKKQAWYQGGRLSQYVEVHAAYAAFKTGKTAVVRKYNGYWDEVTAVLVAGARQVGFCLRITGDGHFLRIVGVTWDEKGVTGFWCNDPYGEADQRPEKRGTYKTADGKYVWYAKAWLQAGRCWGDEYGKALTYFYTR